MVVYGRSFTGGVDFSLRAETAENFCGPDVVVLAKRFDGEVDELSMPVAEAKLFCQTSELLGTLYQSAYLMMCGVYDEW